MLEPVVRLLAGVPSVVYGLIGILALAPWINDTPDQQTQRKQSVDVRGAAQRRRPQRRDRDPGGDDPPIMIALIVDALASVPTSWKEGSAALGVNRWRTIWRVSLRTARPAIVAAAVLATARALGEAIMLAMVSGGARRSPPTRSTGSRSCSSRCGRWRRRSSRNPRSSTIGPVATRCMRWRPCCSSRRRCCRSPAGPPSSR